MGRMSKTPLLALAAALIASAAIAATAEENVAAYQKRDDTMKQLGRNLFVNVGRVVQGRNPYGPETVAAAEAVSKQVADLPSLFPPGSDVPQSKMKPELVTAGDRDAMIAQVQKAAEGLVPGVKEGATNKEAMASAYKAVADACVACHKKYRND
jgi:cytochrome c556